MVAHLITDHEYQQSVLTPLSDRDPACIAPVGPIPPGREMQPRCMMPRSAHGVSEALDLDLRDEPPWDDLDRGIRDVVRAFWDAGLAPVASCQGHGRGDAWVALERQGGWDAERTKIMEVAVDRGWAENCIVSFHEALSPDWPSRAKPDWFEVRWWGAVPFR